MFSKNTFSLCHSSVTVPDIFVVWVKSALKSVIINHEIGIFLTYPLNVVEVDDFFLVKINMPRK
jgi:hypothetical protein